MPTLMHHKFFNSFQTCADLALRKLLDPIDSLFEDVRRKALMRLEYEGLSKCEAVTTKGVRFFNDPAGFSMVRQSSIFFSIKKVCNLKFFRSDTPITFALNVRRPIMEVRFSVMQMLVLEMITILKSLFVEDAQMCHVPK